MNNLWIIKSCLQLLFPLKIVYKAGAANHRCITLRQCKIAEQGLEVRPGSCMFQTLRERAASLHVAAVWEISRTGIGSSKLMAPTPRTPLLGSMDRAGLAAPASAL